MQTFIKVNERVINVQEISSLRFVSDDIYEGLFPKDDKGRYKIDWMSFTFAELKLKTGEVIELKYELYAPEAGEELEEWLDINRSEIRTAWNQLLQIIDPAEITTAREI